MPAISRLFLYCLLLAGVVHALSLSPVSGQEDATGSAPIISDQPGDATPPVIVSAAPSAAPLKLDIARRDLKNFLTDEEAVAPHRTPSGDTSVLREVFVIGAANVSRAFFWDPISCRLLGVLDLEVPESLQPDPAEPADDDATGAPDEDPPSPYILKAAGAMPLFGSRGVSGSPRYFGFRLVGGMPEFLYTFGSLAVEERFWLDDEGKELKQRFAIPEATGGFQITVPEDWRKRATASAGTWKGNVLSVPKESIAEVILSYRLIDMEPQPSDSN